jgi:hypothetical protein
MMVSLKNDRLRKRTSIIPELSWSVVAWAHDAQPVAVLTLASEAEREEQAEVAWAPERELPDLDIQAAAMLGSQPVCALHRSVVFHSPLLTRLDSEMEHERASLSLEQPGLDIQSVAILGNAPVCALQRSVDHALHWQAK